MSIVNSNKFKKDW